MASTRETAIVALVAALDATNAKIARDTDVPDTVPPEGYIIVAEGAADTETILSPLSYAVDQAVNLTVMAAGVDEDSAAAALDALLVAVSDALVADRTLGDAVEWVEVGGPDDFEAFEADGPARGAQLTVTLSFTTLASPLT